MTQAWHILRIVEGSTTLNIVVYFRKFKKSFTVDTFVDKQGTLPVQLADAILSWIEETSDPIAKEYDLASDLVQEVILGVVASAVEQTNL